MTTEQCNLGNGQTERFASKNLLCLLLKKNFLCFLFMKHIQAVAQQHMTHITETILIQRLWWNDAWLTVCVKLSHRHTVFHSGGKTPCWVFVPTLPELCPLLKGIAAADVQRHHGLHHILLIRFCLREFSLDLKAFSNQWHSQLWTHYAHMIISGEPLCALQAVIYSSSFFNLFIWVSRTNIVIHCNATAMTRFIYLFILQTLTAHCHFINILHYMTRGTVRHAQGVYR